MSEYDFAHFSATETNRLHCWSPWGNGNPLDGLPGFNGERADPVSGTYHLGNGYRAYNPVLMRFNCPDSLSPFGAGGINPYAYCAGDPVNHTDPSGHISPQGIIGIIAGIFGLGLSIFTAGASVMAAGSVAAAVSSASTTALVVGGLGVMADVTGIVSGAMEDVNPEASSVLGWVSMATGIAGTAAGAVLLPSGIRAFKQARRASTNINQPAIELSERNISPPPYDTRRLSAPVYKLDTDPRTINFIDPGDVDQTTRRYVQEFQESANYYGDHQLAQSLTREIDHMYKRIEEIGGISKSSYKKGVKVRIGKPDAYTELMIPFLSQDEYRKLKPLGRYYYERTLIVMRLLNRDDVLRLGTPPPLYTNPPRYSTIAETQL